MSILTLEVANLHTLLIITSFIAFQCFPDISSENQRLKDKNIALIRVIGKLSRSPLQQQQQH